MTLAPTPNPLAGRSLRAPVLWGVVFGVLQAVSPLGLWWLDPAIPNRQELGDWAGHAAALLYRPTLVDQTLLNRRMRVARMTANAQRILIAGLIHVISPTTSIPSAKAWRSQTSAMAGHPRPRRARPDAHLALLVYAVGSAYQKTSSPEQPVADVPMAAHDIWVPDSKREDRGPEQSHSGPQVVCNGQRPRPTAGTDHCTL